MDGRKEHNRAERAECRVSREQRGLSLGSGQRERRERWSARTPSLFGFAAQAEIIRRRGGPKEMIHTPAVHSTSISSLWLRFGDYQEGERPQRDDDAPPVLLHFHLFDLSLVAPRRRRRSRWPGMRGCSRVSRTPAAGALPPLPLDLSMPFP